MIDLIQGIISLGLMFCLIFWLPYALLRWAGDLDARRREKDQ